MDPRPSRLRLLTVALLGPLALALLFLAFVLYYRWSQSGITGWLADAMSVAPIRAFGRFYVLRILLPLYTVAGILLWLITLAPLLALDRRWTRNWTWGECLALGLAGFLWAHVYLWWQVPTTLWTIPGLRRVPFAVLFPVLAFIPVAVAWVVAGRRGWSGGRRGIGIPIWLLLWILPAWLPQVMPSLRVAANGGTQKCKVLMVGLDGLRSDTFLDKSTGFQGLRYENAYTPVPATRLLWHVLWGGDPLFYTVGHVGPSIEEFEHPESLTLLKEAKEKGWKPRFYIDDGGTIGLAERKMDLDDALSPAEGWENFINSNLAASFPLYAVWENWFKPFPTTNPWAPLDAGFKEALRLGRGSGWVMFHSCLAHQPIFLSRGELAETGRWWALPPGAFKPVDHKLLVLKTQGEHPDPRTNAFRAYQIRMGAILRAWKPIWNGLATDPDFDGAVRVMFSDHGERFHNVGPNGFQLQGIHGFNLDAWECRVALLATGPGFPREEQTAPSSTSTSLLGIRDGVRRLVQGTGPFDASFLEGAFPEAPLRYHTLDDTSFWDPPGKYRQMSDKEIATHSYIGPRGLWYTEYENPASVRAKDVSVGLARGSDLWVYKPLEEGGAHAFHFQGYDLVSLDKVPDSELAAKRAEVEALMRPVVPMTENAKPIAK